MQKYQVFINDHLISITERIESNQQFDSVFCFKGSDQNEVETIVEWLFTESHPTYVLLVTDDAKNLWEDIQKQFKIVKAAGGIVRNLKNQLLLIHRLGKWDLPKGKMEKDESVEETALREVGEECGITNLILGSQLPSTFHMYRHKEEIVLKHTYWFKMTYRGDEKLVPQKEEGIEKVIWASPESLSEKIENTYSSLKSLLEDINS